MNLLLWSGYLLCVLGFVATLLYWRRKRVFLYVFTLPPAIFLLWPQRWQPDVDEWSPSWAVMWMLSRSDLPIPTPYGLFACLLAALIGGLLLDRRRLLQRKQAQSDSADSPQAD